MKKTQVIDLLTTIRGSAVSFFSILMFVLLGVGLFLGIHWVSGSVFTMANAAYRQGKAHDVQVIFPYGLTDDDMAQLAGIDGVTEVDGAYIAYLRASVNGASSVLGVQSLPHDVDVFLTVEGTLPAREGEAAVDAGWAKDHGVGLGDTLTFDDSGKESDGVTYLHEVVYKVTAFVTSPAYLSRNAGAYGLCTIGSGAVDGFAWLREESFDAASFQDAKPLVLLRSEALASLPTESAEYADKAGALKARVDELGAKLGNARYQDLYNQGKAKLDEGAQAIADAQSKIDSGRTQLDDEVAAAQQKFEEATAQMADGERQIAEAEAQLDESEQELNRYEELYVQAQELYAQVRGALDQLRADVEELRAELQGGQMTREEYEQRIDELCRAVAELLEAAGVEAPFVMDHTTVDRLISGAEDFLAQIRTKEFTVGPYTISYDTAPQVLADARAKLEGFVQQLADKRQQIVDGRAQLEDARQQLAQKVAETEQMLADSQAQVEEKRGELAQSEEELASMRKFEWNVSSRTEGPSYMAISNSTTVMKNLRWSMASLFLIVGLLVCYSAVSRIVHEQSTRIGTKKALGFRASEVMALFMTYSGLAVLLGVLLSLILAIVLVEGLLLNTLNGFFNARADVYLDPLDVLALTGVECLLIGAATWFAVRGVLARQAVELLAGERPAEAKTRFFEKWALWKRMSLLAQTTVNNVINDKRRVLATLVGVAGCAALIVTAVTLYVNINGSLTRSYERIVHFDTMVYPEPGADHAIEGIDRALSKAGIEYLPALRRTFSFKQPDGITTAVTVTVPTDSDDLSGYYTTLPVGDAWADEGILVSQAMNKELGIKVGDEIKLADPTGQTYAFKVRGFFEYHLLNNQVIMDKALYEKSFGTAKSNVVLVKAGSAGVEGVREAVKGESVSSIYDDYGVQSKVFKEFAKLTTIVVAVYLGLAAVIALVVLLNLDVMFIQEKKRELIVLMINGYSVRQAQGYIWHDAVVLTALGIVLGCVLGVVTGGLSVSCVETSMASYLSDICWPAIGVGVAGTVVFAGGVLLWSLRLIGKFELTDIARY